MATFASQFDQYSVPTPIYNSQKTVNASNNDITSLRQPGVTLIDRPISTPSVPSSPGTQAQALGNRTAQMQAEAPETFRAPRPDEFVNPSYYAAAKTKYDTFGNWYSPENTSQMPINAVSPGLQSIQAQLQQSSGLSSNVDPNLTQDAFAGNLAMALKRSSSPTYGTQQQGTAAPVAPQASASGADSYALSQANKLANYTPEAVQGAFGGNEYSVTNAGLQAPTLEQFGGNTEAFNQAANAYDRLALTEQMQAAQSRAQQYVNQQNAYQNAIDEMNRRRAAAEGEQKEIARRSAQERQALTNRLAARGISEATDSWAGQQFGELDRLNNEAQAAAAQAASLSMKDYMTAEDAKLRDQLLQRVASIQTQQQALAKADAANQKNAQDLLMIEQKKNDYESKIAEREGKLNIADRLASLKEALTPAQIASLLAGTEYKGAQTDYLTGAKTDLTKAQTDKTLAQTNRITTLLPAEKARLEAQVKKLLTPPRSGSGGAATGSALTKQFLSLTDNLNADLASGKRDWGQTFNLVKSQYPTVPNDLINTALGGSYNPDTGSTTGWATPGAYQNKKSTLRPTDQLIIQSLSNNQSGSNNAAY